MGSPCWLRMNLLTASAFFYLTADLSNVNNVGTTPLGPFILTTVLGAHGSAMPIKRRISTLG